MKLDGSRVTVCDLKPLRNQFILNSYEVRMATIMSFISTKKLILKYTKNFNGNKKGTLEKSLSKKKAILKKLRSKIIKYIRGKNYRAEINPSI